MDTRRDTARARPASRQPTPTGVRVTAGSAATQTTATQTTITPTVAVPSPWSAQGATTEWFVPPSSSTAARPERAAPPDPRATPRRGPRALVAAAGIAVLTIAAALGALLIAGGRLAGRPDPPPRQVAQAAGGWANHQALAGRYADYQLTIDGRRWQLVGEDYVLTGDRRDGVRQSCSGTVTADDYQLTFTTTSATATSTGTGLPGRQTAGAFCAGVFNAVLYPTGQTLELIDPKSVHTYQLGRH